MSGIALIFRRDGAPVAAGELEAMTAAMAHRAVDGVHHELDGPVGLGFCAMVTTPEPRAGDQPRRCRGGSTLVAMDGRLDDRSTLRARLGVRVPADASDAELLALAVERWGAGFVNNLIGDYAIVVVDLAQRRVVCARDPLGVKPLYYASIGPLFVAASEVSAVLAHPGVPRELVPDAFAAWAENWVIPGGTIYRSISSLPMGSVLVATPNGTSRPSRHWIPCCAADRSLRPADVIEEYRSLVARAVSDRLRSRGPVVVAMSGGLDSSSVAAIALTVGGSSGPDIRIGSLVYPGFPRADESNLIASMERTLGRPVRRVCPEARTPGELAAEIERYLEPPDVPNDQLGALVRPEIGERVLLTGLGGDDWFYNSIGLDITRAVRHGRVASAVRAARRGAADGRHTSALGALWRFGLRPLPKIPGSFITRSDLLSTAITSLAGDLGARFVEASWRPRGVPLDSAWMVSASRDPRLAGLLAVIERRSARRGFEYRHPLHDVRLVELSLRLPGDLRIQDGDARWLPRRAMGDLLPDDVRLRTTKAEFSVAVRQELDLASADGLLDRAIAAWGDGRTRDDWFEIQRMEPDHWHVRLRCLWSVVVFQLWHEALAPDVRAGSGPLVEFAAAPEENP